MKFLLIPLVLLAGAAVPIESAINARLKDAVASPALASLVSFAVGAAIMLLITLSGVMGKTTWAAAAHAPWWVWTGGVLGAAIVTIALLTLPKVGAAPFVVFTVLGQVTAGLAMDHFALLGVPRVPMNGWRVGGALLVLVGVLMTTKK